MALRRTPLKRKTQLKSNSGLKRSGFRCDDIKDERAFRSSLNRVSEKKLKESGGKLYSTLSSKSKGLAGRGRTICDKKFHNRVALLGCIACKKLGVSTPFQVRIHHIDGRYQGGESDHSERRVLPLCDQHHHPSLAFAVNGIKPDLNAPSVHDRKKLFVEMIGSESVLLSEVYDMLNEEPPWITDS